MSFEPVDVHIATALGDPLANVIVKIYDPTGATFYTQGVTNSDGIASFLLETLSYSMRFYQFQTGFSQPQQFIVLAAPDTNVFDVKGEPFVLPTATDPRLCRCSGYFRDLDGSPKKWLDIHFISDFDPILLDSAGVISEERHLRTDEDGYAQIDLIRGAEYKARVESIGGNWLRCIKVPDLASCNLPDVLLPIVGRIVLDPPGPYALAVGEELVVTPQVFDSAGVELVGTAVGDVRWRSSDQSILLVSPSQSTVTLRGNVAGSAQLLATRVDASIIKIPDLPIVGQPVDVVVT